MAATTVLLSRSPQPWSQLLPARHGDGHGKRRHACDGCQCAVKHRSAAMHVAALSVQSEPADFRPLCCAADAAEAVDGAVVSELWGLRRLRRAARLASFQQHRCGTPALQE